MKKLKRVRLVHFYAFDQLDVEIGSVMGIFGPNGSGKSSLLDAIQIAMTGADENRQNLNAQANDGKRSKRNIHGYCLGAIGENRRARDEALSYITLVWEDDTSGEVVSNGVCISCSSDMDRHKVEARYVVRGFDIPLDEHLLQIDGKLHPRPAKDFKRMLQQRGAQVSDDPVLFDSATQYVRALLFALRPSSGTINQESFLRSFVFALAMSFDKSVDEIVRKEVLERRPLDVARFMAVTESFRKLQQLVQRTEEKLGEASTVHNAFNELAKAKSQLAGWVSLESEARLGMASDARSDLESKHSDATEKLEELQESVTHHRQESAVAQQAYETHVLTMNSNEALRRRELLEQEHSAASEARNRSAGSISDLIDRMAHSLDQTQAAVDDCESIDRKALLESLVALNPLQADAFAEPKEKACELLNAAGQVLRRSAQLVRERHFALGQRIDSINAKLKELRENRSRALAGKSMLDPRVAALQQALADEGIHSTPVCDLVEVSDPSWQVAIETYLGPHLQTLLIDNSKQEADAFKLVRQRAFFGARVLMGSRENVGRKPDAGTVAALIGGKSPEVVSYLRRQFGDTRCAETDKEALGDTHTLTRDGMLVSRSSFERLKLIDPSQLKIGMRDRSEQLAGLDQQEREATRLLQQEGAVKARLGALISAISWVEVSNWLDVVRNAFDEYGCNVLKLEGLSGQIATLSLGEAKELVQRKVELYAVVVAAQAALLECAKQIGGVEESLTRLVTDLVQARQMEEALRVGLEQADADPLIDAGWREYQWDHLYEAHGTIYEAILQQCLTKKADAESRERRESATSSRLLGQYLQRFGENALVDQLDWQAHRSWIETVVIDLRDSKLVEYRQQLEEAYHTSQVTFRNDVALAIKQRLDDMNRHLDQLNGALRRCPVFSNGERYRFKRNLRSEHRPLHEFIMRIDLYGAQEDLLGGAGEIPEVFRQLLNARSQPGAAGQATPLDDYGEFFDFDIEILQEDAESGRIEPVGLLSRRVGSGSGGEHRAPLYVIAGAALANAYHLDSQRDGMALIMLDEAFARMDLTNIVATMRYFEDLGLQVLLASPGENMGILDAFMDRYYAIARDGFQVEIEGHDVTAAARNTFRQDLPAFLLAAAADEQSAQFAEAEA
jgi:chromosome segregation protein